MKRIHISKISFSILFTISLLLVINHERIDPFYNSIKYKTLDIIEPLLSSTSSTIYSFSDFSDGFLNLINIRKDNQKLKIRNDFLEYYFHLYKQTKGENQELRRQLNFTQDLYYKYTTGQIISRNNNYLHKELIVNIGSNQGIEEGQMVLANNSLIGRVINTSNNTSNILLITDYQSKIPAIGVNSRNKFITSGLDHNTLSCNYLNEKQLEDKELVITSGDNELILPNIIIGTVFKKEDNFYIKPHVNFDKIEFVQILQP